MMKHLLTGRGFGEKKSYNDKTFRTPAICFSKVKSVSVPILSKINLETSWGESIYTQNVQKVLFFYLVFRLFSQRLHV